MTFSNGGCGFPKGVSPLCLIYSMRALNDSPFSFNALLQVSVETKIESVWKHRSDRYNKYITTGILLEGANIKWTFWVYILFVVSHFCAVYVRRVFYSIGKNCRSKTDCSGPRFFPVFSSKFLSPTTWEMGKGGGRRGGKQIRNVLLLAVDFSVSCTSCHPQTKDNKTQFQDSSLQISSWRKNFCNMRLKVVLAAFVFIGSVSVSSAFVFSPYNHQEPLDFGWRLVQSLVNRQHTLNSENILNYPSPKPLKRGINGGIPCAACTILLSLAEQLTQVRFEFFAERISTSYIWKFRFTMRLRRRRWNGCVAFFQSKIR